MLIDIKKLNMATARGEDWEQALKYMNMEFDTLKTISQTALNEYSKLSLEKSGFRVKVGQFNSWT